MAETPDPIDVANDQAPDAIAALAREMDEAHHRADRFIRRDESGLTAETDPIDLIADLSELLHLGSTMLASPAVDDATLQEVEALIAAIRAMRPDPTEPCPPGWDADDRQGDRNIYRAAELLAAAYLGRTD